MFSSISMVCGAKKIPWLCSTIFLKHSNYKACFTYQKSFMVVSRAQWVKTTSSMRTESRESMKNSFTTVTKMTLLSGQQRYERLGTKNCDVSEGGVGRWG